MISPFIPVTVFLSGLLTYLSLQQSASADFNPVPYALPESFGSSFGYRARFLNADLDADGKQDVVAFYTAKGVFWRRSLGATDLAQPPLAPPERLAILTRTFDFVRIGDLDGDGYPDIVCSTANHPSNDTVYWLRNLCGQTGVVSFDQTPRTISTAFDDNIALFLEDIDSDGDIDVITGSNFSSERFHVHTNRLNEGNPTFGAPVLLFEQGRYLDNESVAFHDYDSDGDLDVSTTQFLTGGKETIVWLENKLHDLESHTLEISPDLAGPEDLPVRSLTPRLIVAKIQGELWFRFLKASLPPAVAPPAVTFRESLLNASTDDLAGLKADLDALRNSGVDLFAVRQLKKKVTKVTGFKTSGSITFTRHELFSGPIPASVSPNSFRYYSPDQFLSADLDGDGDTDFFTGYTGSYGPMMGWFENRLNERNHEDFSGLQLMDVDLYGGSAVIAELNGNHLPDLIYRGTDSTMRVLYDFRGLRDGLPSCSETVTKHGVGQYSTEVIGNCGTVDLDGDGDLEIVGDLIAFGGAYLLVSENLGTAPSPAAFDRHETELVGSLPLYNSYPYLRAKDQNSDGKPDISVGSGFSYRNRYDSPPDFDFTKDSTLTEFPAPPAVPDTAFGPFDQWVASQPWQRTRTTLSRSLADIDMDGDDDVVMLHWVFDGPTSISWFENRMKSSGGYRGPLGISGNLDETSKFICADIDSDGDPDLLAFGYLIKDGIMYKRVFAFRNRSSASDKLIDRFVRDENGFYQNSLSNPSFSATLRSSPDLNWTTADTQAIPPHHLGNPAAMRHHMKWLDPAQPKRFFRMEYKLVR